MTAPTAPERGADAEKDVQRPGTARSTRGARAILVNFGYTMAAVGLAVVVAVLISAVALAVAGHPPVSTFTSMIRYGVCSQTTSTDPCTLDSLISILQRAVPYYLSALAVAIGFRMALFNIGVEGQYHIAALFAAAVGAAIHLPAPIHVLVMLLVAMLVGAVWSGIAGLLKVTRGVSEVISTIMLNYIAYGMISYLLGSYFSQKASGGQTNLSSSTKDLPASGRMPGLNHLLGVSNKYTEQIPGFLIVALVAGVLFYLIVERTTFGFGLRASGMNPFAAQASGVNSRRMVVITMLISGALAGLVGLPYLMGQQYNYSNEFPANYGFNGIAVALLGRNRPGGIAFAALLWGFLERSAQILDLNGIPKEIVVIMQGVIVLSVVVAYEVMRRVRVRQAEREVARELHVVPDTEERVEATA